MNPIQPSPAGDPSALTSSPEIVLAGASCAEKAADRPALIVIGVAPSYVVELPVHSGAHVPELK